MTLESLAGSATGRGDRGPVPVLATTAWAPLPLLFVCWAVFGQVVSFRGLLVWVVLGSLSLWLVVGALFSVGRRWLGMVVGMLGTLLVAGAAEWLGGTSSGPLARSTLLACGLTVAALILAFSSAPVLSLVPMLGLLGAGLALGAAGSAVAWIGAWVVAAACSLVILGPYGSGLLAQRIRLLPLAWILAGVGGGAIAIAVIASAILGRPWMMAGVEGNWLTPPVVSAVAASSTPSAAPPASPAPSVSDSAGVDASTTEPSPPIRPTPEVAAPQPRPAGAVVIAPAALRSVEAPQAEGAPISVWLAFALAILLLWLVLLGCLLLCWFVGRRAVAWAQWQVLRLRLATGPAESQVIGAWTWVRLRRARCDRPLPAWAAPDAVVRWDMASDPALDSLARITADVAFNPAGRSSRLHARLAWRHARSAARAAQIGSLRQRIRWTAVSPPSVDSLPSL